MYRGGGSTCVGGGVGRLARSCRVALAAWHGLPVWPGDASALSLNYVIALLLPAFSAAAAAAVR